MKIVSLMEYKKKVLLNNLGSVVFKATNLLSFWDIRIVIDSQFFLFLHTYNNIYIPSNMLLLVNKNVLFDEPLKDFKSLKSFKITLTFRFEKRHFSLHTTGYFMNDNESDGIENAFPKLTWILVFLI
jgi:hypothetical protein